MKIQIRFTDIQGVIKTIHLRFFPLCFHSGDNSSAASSAMPCKCIKYVLLEIV